MEVGIPLAVQIAQARKNQIDQSQGTEQEEWVEDPLGGGKCGT